MSEQEPDKDIHVHIWDADSEKWDDEGQPIEIKAEMTDEYDDHYQFGWTHPDGTWIEMRLWKSQFKATATKASPLPIERVAQDFMCYPQLVRDPFRDEGETYAQSLRRHIEITLSGEPTQPGDIVIDPNSATTLY